METSTYYNAIPIGECWACLAVGLQAKVSAYFEGLKSQYRNNNNGNRPPKHTIPILQYIIDLTQRENVKNFGQQLKAVEISQRDLATELGGACQKTIGNTLKWLERQGWVKLETGLNPSVKTAITLNVDKIKSQFINPPTTTTPKATRKRKLPLKDDDTQEAKTPNGCSYDNQLQDWQSVLG